MNADSLLRGSSLTLECLVAAVRHRPWNALRAVVWATRGREHLRRELAARCHLDPAALPYRAAVIDELRRAPRQVRA